MIYMIIYIILLLQFGKNVPLNHRLLSKHKDEKILITIQKHSGRTSEILVFDQPYQIIR